MVLGRTPDAAYRMQELSVLAISFDGQRQWYVNTWK
jgi:hypothetical protein